MADTQDELDLREAYKMGYDRGAAQKPPMPSDSKNEQFYMIGYEDGAGS